MIWRRSSASPWCRSTWCSKGVDYRDGVDISTPELLRMMEGCDTLPVTSQPTPADFMEVYKALFEEGYTQILSIHLARALSATIEQARAIAGELPEGLRLEVVDSGAATVLQGAMVLEAAVIAQNGGSIEDAIERVRAIRKSAAIHFVPNTLDNLVKGGRATKAQGFVTSLLNIKLVIGLEQDGSIEGREQGEGRQGRHLVHGQAHRRGRGRGGSARLLPAAHQRARPRAQDRRGAGQGARGHLLASPRRPSARSSPRTWGEGAIGVFYYPAALHAPELDDISTYLTPHF